MTKVLIVDDEMLARDELKYLLHRTKEIDHMDEAESVEEALEKMMDCKPDLVFLDIQLSDDSGFEIANILKRMKNPPAIVFATAYDQYALQAFDVDALDYILKPFDEERIAKVIQKFKKRKQNEEGTAEEGRLSELSNQIQKLALSVEESIILVNIEDIIFTGLVDGKVIVKTFQGTYETHDTLVILEKKLPQMTFMRVHRGFLVNINHISEVQPWFNSTYNLIMKDDSKVPVSRTYAKELKKLLRI